MKKYKKKLNVVFCYILEFKNFGTKIKKNLLETFLFNFGRINKKLSRDPKAWYLIKKNTCIENLQPA